MRLSVVIAALNEGDRLWRTVESCRETTAGLDGEILVVDDASTDGSVEQVRRRFPEVRVVAHAERLGVAPTRCAGARAARGDVLVFLDGHCKPEPGAIAQLVDDVERLDGRAILAPRIAVLDAERWENRLVAEVGHGFRMDLETLGRAWIPRERMQACPGPAGRWLYECPALAGCCLALSRSLYLRLRGFDRGMRMWGSEDLDLGLKAWLMGAPVLHDPGAIIGHWFRTGFDNYPASEEHVVVNQLRTARKHLGDAAWHDWLGRCRARSVAVSWPAVWELFRRRRSGVEHERAYLMAHRVRDEFWYAERFGLWWPRWLAGRTPEPAWGEEVPLDPRELFRKHALRPRNRAGPSDVGSGGPAAPGGRGTLTIELGLMRERSGAVHVARATFRGGGDPATTACASWLTSRIEGEPLAWVRALGADSLQRALGLDPSSFAEGSAADTSMAALRRALERL